MTGGGEQERRGAADPGAQGLARLRRAVEATGHSLHSPELLDVLWLAGVMGPASGTSADARVRPHGDAAPEGGPAAPGGGPVTGPGPEPPGPEPSPGGFRHRLFTAHGADGPAGAGSPVPGPAHPVRVPAPRALPDPPGLARALRPLTRYRDHPGRTAVDIEATVRLTAESGVLDLVDRPRRERRHSAVLLLDGSPSMRLWRHLADDVERLLRRCGVFRAVHVRRFDPQGPPPRPLPSAEAPLAFLLSDGVDGAWRTPAAARLLAAWDRAGPLVVVDPLPRRLWNRTAFDAQPRLLMARREFARAGELTVLDGPAATGAAPGLPPVPVVALTPASLTAWTRLLTRPGAPHLVDTVTLPIAPAPVGEAAAPAALPPEELVTRFRGSFSPDAYSLAVRLSAIRPLTVPLMRLVRVATLPAAASSTVAEVLHGGLLTALDRTSPAPGLSAALGDDTWYDFAPGVRDLLAGGLGTERALEVVEAVGEALAPHLGRVPDFAALLAGPGGGVELPPSASAFASLVSPVLDRLTGGTYGTEVASEAVAERGSDDRDRPGTAGPPPAGPPSSTVQEGSAPAPSAAPEPEPDERPGTDGPALP
ncbi:SAV_2336 N-terminal domain-related protein, partial [Streptomyces sp. NPDC057638]|uniref:SAV_2336 N-terminal domain-related protein n=1 Tax=Streptomyces sp. NPDC057638 TaxID=3346190 RepID=UPI0036C423F4